jgi:hypothetical protein
VVPGTDALAGLKFREPVPRTILAIDAEGRTYWADVAKGVRKAARVILEAAAANAVLVLQGALAADGSLSPMLDRLYR